jgi:membrane-bound inhibitor of C-type lysozyme
MENTPPANDTTLNQKHAVFQVTKLSKVVALIIFIIAPFIGGYIGYTYAPVNIVEVESVAIDSPTAIPEIPTYSEPTERYIGIINGSEVIFEHTNYTSYKLAKDGVMTAGELNTERGYKDDDDATVFILDWQKPVQEQSYFVKLSATPTTLQALTSDRTINSTSVLELALEPVIFNCPDSSYFQVIFTPNNARLSYPDGRTMQLTQSISASGARYTNSDESFVFWNKGEAATIEENGNITQSDCSTNPIVW